MTIDRNFLARALDGRAGTPFEDAEDRARPTDSLGLSADVGVDAENRPQDVAKAKTALAAAGALSPAASRRPGFGQAEVEATRAYQSQSGLKPDGLMRPAGETDRNLALDSAIKRGVRKPFGQEAADFQGLARSLDADPEVAKAQGAQFALAALGRPAYDRTKGPPPFVTRLGVDALNQWRTAQGFAPRNSGLPSLDEEATLAAAVQTAAFKPVEKISNNNNSVKETAKDTQSPVEQKISNTPGVFDKADAWLDKAAVAVTGKNLHSMGDDVEDFLEWTQDKLSAGLEIGKEISPGADLRDYQQFGQLAIENAIDGEVLQAIEDMGWAGAAIGGLFLPGSASSIRRAADAGSNSSAIAAKDEAYERARTAGLEIDDASRAKRAEEQGYSDEIFYRGQQDVQTESGVRFYSRDKEVSDGHARSGGSVGAFRLLMRKPLVWGEEVTLKDYVTAVQEVARTNPSAAKRLAADIPLSPPHDGGGWTIEKLAHLASGKFGDERIIEASRFEHVLGLNNGDSVGPLRAAGFDSIDTGRDVRMLKASGQRSVDAVFNPKDIDSKDLWSSVNQKGSFRT